MKNYIQMSKEEVISLSEKAIRNILKEKQARKTAAIEAFKTHFKPTLFQRLGLKEIPNFTDDYVMQQIKYKSAIEWDSYYHNLVHYGDDIISDLRKLTSSAKLAEGYVLVNVELANSLNKWSMK
jgi:hypothetical protein